MALVGRECGLPHPAEAVKHLGSHDTIFYCRRDFPRGLIYLVPVSRTFSLLSCLITGEHATGYYDCHKYYFEFHTFKIFFTLWCMELAYNHHMGYN